MGTALQGMVMQMRVLYLTLPALLDVSLCFASEMSSRADLHILLQLTPNAWKSSLFDLNPVNLPAGLTPAAPLLQNYPQNLQKTWQAARSFQLAVFGGSSAASPLSWRTSWQLVRFARQMRPDVIHFETTSGRMAWALPWLHRIAPLVLTVHDPQPHSGEAPLKKRLIRTLTFGQADQYILHNRAQLAAFCQERHVPEERAHCIPLGVYYLYPMFSRNTLPVDPKMVLFFGRLSPYKGIETLLQAAHLVCEKTRDVNFVIAGRPIPGYQLPELPELPNGGRWEVIHEYIPNERLAELFQQAALVVCPYTDATQSGVVLTAYAFGKPVVATRVGGLPEYVLDGQTGRLVEAGNPAALADGIHELLAMPPAELQQRVETALHQKCSSEWSWGRIAQETMGVYQQAVDGFKERRKA